MRQARTAQTAAQGRAARQIRPTADCAAASSAAVKMASHIAAVAVIPTTAETRAENRALMAREIEN